MSHFSRNQTTGQMRWFREKWNEVLRAKQFSETAQKTHLLWEWSRRLRDRISASRALLRDRILAILRSRNFCATAREADMRLAKPICGRAISARPLPKQLMWSRNFCATTPKADMWSRNFCATTPKASSCAQRGGGLWLGCMPWPHQARRDK